MEDEAEEVNILNKNVTKESKKFDKDLCEDHLGASATFAMSVFTMLCVQDHPQHD